VLKASLNGCAGRRVPDTHGENEKHKKKIVVNWKAVGKLDYNILIGRRYK